MFESHLRRIVAQHGVFLRREAHGLGYDDKAFQRVFKSGVWVRVHHGCYTFADTWESADDRERHSIKARAILRTHGEGVVLSHTSAVNEHPVDLWGLDLDRVHVTMPPDGKGGLATNVHRHVGTWGSEDVETRNGIPSLVLPRAIVETLMISDVEPGLVLTNSALNKKLVSSGELWDRHAQMDDWPGARTADLVLRLADGRAESVGETRALHLMWRQGTPMPELQFKVHHPDGRLAGITDFAWPEHKLLGEFDGKVKYGRLLRDGEDPGDAVFREKVREDLLRELTGWRMIRFVWADLYHAYETGLRIRRMLQGIAA